MHWAPSLSVVALRRVLCSSFGMVTFCVGCGFGRINMFRQPTVRAFMPALGGGNQSRVMALCGASLSGLRSGYLSRARLGGRRC